jgi:hypothetical protein
MQCIETCSARKTYPELLDNPIGHIAFLRVGGGRVVSKRVGRLLLPRELDNSREVFPAQET